MVLLLGGNKPNTIALLQQAKDLLSDCFGAAKQVSGFYTSEAWGFEAADFINQALVYETAMAPDACLAYTQKVEKALGRQKKTQNGVYQDRAIDIDIIFYGQEEVSTEHLQIPHPLMAQRRFVLLPLFELLPDFVHPQLHKTIAQLLDICPDTSLVKPKKA